MTISAVTRALTGHRTRTPDNTAMPTARLSRVAVAGLTVATLAAVPLAGAAATTPTTAVAGAPAAAPVVSAPTGWLRIAQLAPKIGPMDVYLTASGASSAIVLPNVGYGTFSQYSTLKPGTFALAMRPAGSSALTAPIASYEVTVKAGTAYTVAALGTPGHLTTELFDDALVRPPAGSARVRLIQGAPAAGSVTVSAVDGPLLAQNVPYGAVTGYANVPQGRWSLKVTEDGKSVATQVDVAAGGVYSLVVIQKADGALTLDTGVDVSGKKQGAVGKGSAPVSMSVQTDAADSTSQPKGSVNTGEGGTAPDGTVPGGAARSSAAAETGAVLAAVAGLGFTGALIRRRRVAPRP